MQSSEDSALGNTSIISSRERKRKLQEQHNRGISSRPPATNLASSGAGDPKRAKLSSTTSDKRTANMSRSIGAALQPRVIDLTRPSNFQPHSGAKRLVVKNLRPPPAHEVEKHYGRIWTELDLALGSVFREEQPGSPLEVLCRGVEATCRKGRAPELFELLKDRCKTYLDKQMLPTLQREVGAGNVGVLRTVQKYWTIWNKQSVGILICGV